MPYEMTTEAIEAIEAEFKTYYMPAIYRREAETTGHTDEPLRCEEWNNYTDALCKEGRVTDAYYNEAEHPDWLLSDEPSKALGPNWKSMLLGNE